MNRKLTRRLILCALIMFVVAPGVLLADETITPMSVVIKPGSDVNPFNTRSRGVTPVAILDDEFIIDVRDIDPVSIACTGVEFEEGVVVPFEPGVKPIRSSYEDLDGNGFEDINLKFDTQSILNALQNAASLGGYSLVNGQTVNLIFSALMIGATEELNIQLEGSDTILIKLNNANNGRNVKNVKKPKTR